MRAPVPVFERPLILAAGGTGGHVIPAQVLAAELTTRGWQVVLVTDGRGAQYLDRVPSPGAERHIVAGAGAIRSAVLLLPTATVLGAGMAIQLRRRRAACVVGFGGYASVPAMLGALLAGVPRIVLEQNAVLGRTNRLCLRTGAQLACGIARLPEAGREAVLTGNPLRSEIRACVGGGYRPPQAGEPIRILLVGGSQGARAVPRIIAGVFGQLPGPLRRRLRLVAQVRPEECADMGARLRAIGVAHTLHSFLDDLATQLTECHLVIARAGASTISELAAMGRPSVLIPFPGATDDHQGANSAVLADAGGAWIHREGDASAVLASSLATLLESPQQLARMAAAARVQGRPDATARLADLVERRALPPPGGRA